MNLIDFIDIKEKKWFFKVKVIPNSAKTEIIWIMDDGTIKVKSRWIPEKWKVNIELINFISKELKINKKEVSITSGITSKNKLIKIDFL